MTRFIFLPETKQLDKIQSIIHDIEHQETQGTAKVRLLRHMVLGKIRTVVQPKKARQKPKRLYVLETELRF